MSTLAPALRAFFTDRLARQCQASPCNALEPDKARLMEPGPVYQFEIDLIATSVVFEAAHHIRVEVSSSNFSLASIAIRAVGQLSADGTESTLVPARQTISTTPIAHRG